MNRSKAALVAYGGFAVALLGPIGANVRLLPPLVGFVFFVAGTFLALGGAVAKTVQFMRGSRADVGALVGYGPFLLVLMLLAKALTFPPLNDVTTDLNEIPGFTAASELPQNKGRDMSYPEPFKELMRKHYGDVASKILPGQPSEVMDQAKKLFEERSYIKVTRDDRQANELEAIFESGFFRFKDDVILRFRANRQATVVDVRSKSRDGKGDVGANAARVRDILKALETGKWE